MLRNAAKSLASKVLVPTSAARYSTEVAATQAGVSFGLNEDQMAIQDLARSFTAGEITPVAAEYDKSMAYPWDVIKKAHSAGLMNSTFALSLILRLRSLCIQCCSIPVITARVTREMEDDSEMQPNQKPMLTASVQTSQLTFQRLTVDLDCHSCHAR